MTAARAVCAMRSHQANTNAQADTINFDPAFFNVARTITLTSGEINITATIKSKTVKRADSLRSMDRERVF